MREKLATRLGFVLLSAGCAIGLGNVWRFPYIVGKNGGGWFVVLYLVFLAVLALPVLVMEFAAGRAADRSPVCLHKVLAPEKPAWRIHGAACLIGNTILMMFYTTVTGWMLLYFRRMVLGAFTGADADAVSSAFGGMLANPWEQIAAMALVTLLAAGVCLVGLRRGVERVTKWLMLCLLVLIIVLATNSVWLDARDGDPSGLRFYLIPDLARMKEAGVITVIVEAMNHSFFTLSLGIGAMAIFGSYIGRDRTLLGEAIHVGVLDTLVALSSGVIIIPACFAYGINPGQGPGLIFATLPTVFNNMSLGRLWGSLFFIFMSCAALTTVIAVLEAIIACVMDVTGWTRRRSGLTVVFALLLLSLPCILGFNAWRAFTPFGAGSNVLDLEDFIVSNLLLPLGSLCFVLLSTHRFGWGWERFLDEANAGVGIRFRSGLRFYCRWILPFLIVLIFVLGLIDRFS